VKARQIVDGVQLLGAVDWDRRLFDALIPLPDGTSYNAYLVRGADKTVLLDAADPATADELLGQLADVPTLDYVVAHHVEQDHSGAIPQVLARYPEARVLCSKPAVKMLVDHLAIPEARIIAVADGETLDLGGKTLKFVYTPWVHWPETMVTYLAEDRILFSCDFFGSHLATTDVFADEKLVYEPAKRYYAEIMMPFSKFVLSNIEKLRGYDVGYIAPSHGPVFDRPAFIVEAYREWAAGAPRNVAIVAYVSMHESTKLMADRLVLSLVARGVAVRYYNLIETDIGKLAADLVDAATVVIGTPIVLGGPHPHAAYAAIVTNALRPKVKHLAVFGSFGWGGKVIEKLTDYLSALGGAELLPPVLAKGLPRESDFAAIDALAETIAAKHAALGLK
jgi:flavorubredoxin